MNVLSVGMRPSNQISKLSYTGLLVHKGSESSHFKYKGMSSSYNVDGNYEGSDDVENNVYYPFKDESEREIEQALKENNYSSSYDSYGYGGGLTINTERGRTLPYTKKEWNRLAKNVKDNILKLL